MIKIMMLEDDKTISFAVQTFLKKFEMETTVFYNLNSVTERAVRNFDLVILDVNLPDGSGFDFLKWIRGFSDIPVILLTVKGEEEYVLKGFSEGADEYMTKPFSLPVLKVRIDNVMRRRMSNSQEILFDDLSVDFLSQTAKIGEQHLELNKQEFSVLSMFLENQNINITREHIIDSVWGYDLYEINDNTLTVTIKRLRHKLGKYGDHIKTVRGIGYVWKRTNNEKV